MSSGGRQGGSGGCAALFAALLVIALVIAALISLAALVDPFSWLPPVGEVWSDCHETAEGACDLGNRFPGFWGHAIANLAYTTVTGICLIVLGAGVFDLREARQKRFDGHDEAKRFVEVRHGVIGVAVAVAALAAVPIVVALA